MPGTGLLSECCDLKHVTQFPGILAHYVWLGAVVLRYECTIESCKEGGLFLFNYECLRPILGIKFNWFKIEHRGAVLVSISNSDVASSLETTSLHMVGCLTSGKC